MRFLDESLVALDVEVTSSYEAIKAAGALLVNERVVEETYVEAMLQSYQKNGPYFVLAPKVALPHARPEDGVKEASVSFIRLKNPVEFGSKLNDPVKFVFALGASSSDEHIQILQKLTLLLNDPTNLEQLELAISYQDIKKIIGGKQG
ncbi:MAG TPA: PTS sugar transporter subunit IIA [Bacillus sp. (in: firmicutes)]|uniref:PTS sugar transporter subunit IIA n=1 Tax=Bacillus litorisediminis TaxID=2922713 RepID=UPI001FABE31A|nr:PTS sugar transporter subunit IIA [Bacillus litorisediminis]HWO76192.1 PTS sugar transporter subunit IIA [Bacillus sp. (in: firmicutes)]